MGLCVDCKYHVMDNSGKPIHPEIHTPRIHIPRPWLLPGFYESDHKCICKDNYETDFITGDSYFPSCYSKNRFEECPYWEESEENKVEDTETSENTSSDSSTEGTGD